jgi:SAM-dependent methyltransferase
VLDQYYNDNYAKSQLDFDERSNSFSKIAALWRETKSQMRILDLGCGAGSVSGELVKRGHEVYGLDIMREAVDRARKRGIRAETFDINSVPLPFKDGFFDCILALDILEHLFQPLSLMREMNRALSPTGYAIVFLPLHFDIRQRLRVLVGKGILLYEHLWYNPNLVSWDYFHIRFYTLEEAERFVRAAGFCIQQRVYRPIMAADMGWLGHRLFNPRAARFLSRRLPTLFASGIQMLIGGRRQLETDGQHAFDCSHSRCHLS